jgi:uncharacterized protein YbjT (DUF2867 family)
MSTVLVTGSTGDLGMALVPALRAAAHKVRAMSRTDGDVQANLVTGVGLTEAVAGCDVVVHAASDPAGDPQATDVAGTRRLADTCRAEGVQHLLYVSIVGVDRNPLPYYTAKLEAERIVAQAGVPYSIVRGAQFHEFIAGLLTKRLRRGPILFLPARFAAQPVAVDDLARYLVDRIAAGPSGTITEFVGPERLSGREILHAWRAAGRRAGPVVPLWRRDGAAKAFRMKSNIASPDAARGQIGWAQWLREHPQETPVGTSSHDAG